MSMRAGIARATALAALAIARSGLGVQVTYNARGTDVTVYAIPESSADESMRVTIGTRSIEKHRKFNIPTQTGFPPTLGIITDDTITDENSNVYRVVSWNNNDDIGAMYSFECVYTKTKQFGAVGQ